MSPLLNQSPPIAPETDQPSSAAKSDIQMVKDTDKQPQRAAAQRGKEKVMNWVKQLGAPLKDVMG